jgi:hypothetical protein
MKRIATIHTVTLLTHPGETVDAVVQTGVVKTIMETAHKNRLSVIESALSVERILEEIIIRYFLGDSHDMVEAFESLILRADWCSFAAKRHLAIHLVKDKDLLGDRELRDFDELLGKTISFRNAFTHGRMYGDAKGRVFLSYFKGSPKDVEITDEYLTHVETTLQSASDKTTALLERLKLATN